MKQYPNESMSLQRLPTRNFLLRYSWTQCSVHRMAFALIFGAILHSSCFMSAFTLTSATVCRRSPRFGVPVQPRSLTAIAQARFTPLAHDDTGPSVLLDAQGKEVKVGSVIRVVANNLKAYQVSLPGYGRYGPDKKFIPAPPGGERGTKNLLLPVGMRGVVSKVYDVDDISANHPIQVKFFPGRHVDEGYDPPVPFVMHFSPEEIECV